MYWNIPKTVINLNNAKAGKNPKLYKNSPNAIQKNNEFLIFKTSSLSSTSIK